VAQLRRHQDKFDAAGVRIVLVGLGTPEQAEAFRKDFKLDFPLICDPDRALYAAYGLQRTGLVKMASPSLFVKGIKAMVQGGSLGVPQGDIQQLSGVFIIDRKGIIRFAHRAQDPADHPSAEEILSALKGMDG
jgi:peroxiredoxin